GGEIGLISAPGLGSTFTLYLPQSYVPQKLIRRPTAPRVKSLPAPIGDRAGATTNGEGLTDIQESLSLTSEFGDDRNTIGPEDRVLLVVDNDLDFAHFVLDSAHKLGFKVIITPWGAHAISLASDYQPHAITLDISLPDVDGWRVLERLK